MPRKKKDKPQDSNYWLFRPLIDEHRDWHGASPNWVQEYWDSNNHPHRRFLASAIIGLGAESVLEVGCNCGTNLRVLREMGFSDTSLAGVDINADVIAKGKSELPAVNFQVADAINIPFPDYSFDCTFLDAVLIYIQPDDIEHVISEISRVTRKFLILVEWFDNNSIQGVLKNNHWARNYEKLLSKFGWEVTKRKISFEEWPNKNWAKYGYIFTGKKIDNAIPERTQIIKDEEELH